MPFRILEQPNTEVNENIPIKGKFRIVEQLEPSENAIPSPKSEQIAESFKFFGHKPSTETIEKIRHPIGVAEKGLAKGLIGGPGELINFAQGLMGIEKPIPLLPTTEHVGKFFDKLSGEQFNPENLTEEIADRGFEFLGGMLGLGGMRSGGTLLKTFGKNILSAFAPAGVSVVSEKAGLPPWAQVASTIGTSFLTHRLTGKSLKEVEGALHSHAKKLAGDSTISAKTLENNFSGLKKILEKGVSTPTTNAIKSTIKELKGKIKSGNISVEDLTEAKSRIYEKKSEVFAKLGFKDAKGTEGLWKKLTKDIDNTIKEYEKINPEFSKVYRQANSLTKGIADTKKMGKWLLDNKFLTGLGGILLKTTLPVIFQEGLIGTGAAQAGLFMRSLARNPGYRKAYFDVLKNASKEDLKGTATALKVFNKKTEQNIPELIQD